MLLPFCSARPVASAGRVLCWLSLCAAGLSGCAQSPSRSLARMWDQMPAVRWSPKEGHADDDTPGASLAAKLRSKPAKTDDEGKTRITDKSALAKKRAKSEDPLSQLARRQSSSPKDPFLEDEMAAARLAHKDGSIASNDELDAVTVSRREQLKAELADDSRRSAPPETQSSEQARLKLRVESTMERARLHLANDELAEAQRAAELAQRLTESSGLEFAPDEEQPIELLTDIMARREAEREKAALADSEDEVEPAQDEPHQATPIEIKPATVNLRDANPAFAYNDADFDPYARRAAAEQDPAADSRVFSTALVVLESPSFEDEIAAMKPADYAKQPEGDRRELRVPFVRKTVTRETSVDDIPVPPAEEETTTEETRLLLPTEATELETAPLPPVTAGAGPKLEPATSDELPADLDRLDETEDDIKSAGALPRWLPLSILSLLTAGLCIWLWRHRTMFTA